MATRGMDWRLEEMLGIEERAAETDFVLVLIFAQADLETKFFAELEEDLVKRAGTVIGEESVGKEMM